MDYPKLRPIEAFPVDLGGREVVCLRDPTHLTGEAVFVPREALFILAHFDGQHSILDIQEAYTRQSGELLFSDTIKAFIAKLDEHLLLDNDRFQAYKRQVIAEFRGLPSRPAAHAGEAYEADPIQLETQLASYFAPPEGPGHAAPVADEGMTRGV